METGRLVADNWADMYKLRNFAVTTCWQHQMIDWLLGEWHTWIYRRWRKGYKMFTLIVIWVHRPSITQWSPLLIPPYSPFLTFLSLFPLLISNCTSHAVLYTCSFPKCTANKIFSFNPVILLSFSSFSTLFQLASTFTSDSSISSRNIYRPSSKSWWWMMM